MPREFFNVKMSTGVPSGIVPNRARCGAARPDGSIRIDETGSHEDTEGDDRRKNLHQATSCRKGKRRDENL
jgi:hypothetical protein